MADSGFVVKALHAFPPVGSDYEGGLEIHAGDLITVVDSSNAEWWTGYLSSSCPIALANEFREADLDGSGHLDRLEVKQLVSKLGYSCPSEYLDELFTQFGTDEAVEYKDFCKLWLHLTRGDANAFGFFPCNFVEVVSEAAAEAAAVGQQLAGQPEQHIVSESEVDVAVGETVILLHPLLPLVGVSIWMERGCQQTDSLANG